jgi:tRNA dimethylallyltransferase
MQNNKKNKILIIAGPTASGKSALALQIAKEQSAKGEKSATESVIINADSMQIYKELPILSAQPSAADQQQVPHFLYSILKHNENSSVFAWLKLAQQQIDIALAANKLPIIVGGTGLYISSLVQGISKIDDIDDDLRQQIRQICQNCSQQELVKMLQDLGENIEQIENLDRQRLGRRLEVLKQTGKTLSWWQNQPKKIFYPPDFFEFKNIELKRENLYQNCNLRFKKMLENGAAEEVKEFLKLKPDLNSPIAKTIGLLQIKDWLEGKISQEEVIKMAAQKTRNYAKRQLTWFRHQFVATK